MIKDVASYAGTYGPSHDPYRKNDLHFEWRRSDKDPWTAVHLHTGGLSATELTIQNHHPEYPDTVLSADEFPEEIIMQFFEQAFGVTPEWLENWMNENYVPDPMGCLADYE